MACNQFRNLVGGDCGRTVVRSGQNVASRKKIRMVDESDARRYKLLENLRYVVSENVEFGMDEGIE
jgi:hypothetical protein